MFIYDNRCERIFVHRMKLSPLLGLWKCGVQQDPQGRIKLFGAPRQLKHFRPLFQAVFLSGEGGYYPPD